MNEDKITFGPEEKEIIEILGSFENELRENKECNKNELQSIKYYENFNIKGMRECVLSGIFVTEENDSQGNKITNVYYREPSNKIFSIDDKGNIELNPEWKKILGYVDLGKSTDIEDLENEDLKGISEKASPEKIREKLNNKKDDKNEQKEEDEEKEKPEDQIQKDTGKDEELDIGYYREITDNDFGEQMGMNLNQYQEIGLAYSKAQNAFILVGKKDGKFQQVEGFEPAQPTYKKVLDIDEKAENVGNEVPHALMKTNNPEKELSITIGQYGYIEVGTVDRLPCDVRVKRQVGEQGEARDGETVDKLNKEIKQEGKESTHNWAEQHEKANNEIKQGESRKGDITKEISNSNNYEECIPGTNMTWREFANACGYRGEGDIEDIKHAKKIFQEAKAKNPNKTNQKLADDIIDDKFDETPYGQRIQN